MASHYLLLIQSIEDMCLLAHVPWVSHDVVTGYTAFSVLYGLHYTFTHTFIVITTHSQQIHTHTVTPWIISMVTHTYTKPGVHEMPTAEEYPTA